MRWLIWLLVLLLVPLLVSTALVLSTRTQHWSLARWDSTGLAPAPAVHPAAVVQVYAARAWGWKGAVAVHCWVAFKREGAAAYERYEVVGWGVAQGAPAIRRNLRPPDGRWAGSEPELLVDLRGAAAAAVIPRLEDAIARYPYPHRYVTWPGPNSNTFVVWLAREVPELHAALPSTAIGKDFLPGGRLLAPAPSGTGFQLSLAGVLGLTLALDEGLELNLLGFVVGIAPKQLAIKLPGLGQLGWSRSGPDLAPDGLG
ncbi:DUF3750 domain-containing protein [Benzoatithermus flavus]|uniref:DUF3750 domain-containing protein n=1 Tax=Benzoatithermus flavus TaxID=3108223 RepID=A0ABU8XPB2_9PROT